MIAQGDMHIPKEAQHMTEHGNRGKESISCELESLSLQTAPLVNQWTIKDVAPHVIKSEYAIRGKILLRALKIEAELTAGVQKPFKELVYANIGNPQQFGIKPISFYRRVSSLALNPELIPLVEDHMPSDVIARAKEYIRLIGSPGTGAYTESQGFKFIRKEVADFIVRRDNITGKDAETYCSPDNIYLTSGATGGIRYTLLLLISGRKDGIMISTPQYCMYSAMTEIHNGTMVRYYLDEDNNWGLSPGELDRSYEQAVSEGIRPKCLVVINPGNPTGQVLSLDNMVGVIKFCHRRKIVLLADEVYQNNVFENDFISFKKVKHILGPRYRDLAIVSMNSISKGFTGECGMRGGYAEFDAVDSEILDQLYKICSMELGSSSLSQLIIGMTVNPPQPGDPSYPEFLQEKNDITETIERRARMAVDILNSIDGVKCNPAQGSLYLFPSITIPPKAVAEAQERNLHPDEDFCMKVLERTGLCCVPGSGFGQSPGTYHFRITVLPQEDKLRDALLMFKKFYLEYIMNYSD